MFSIIIIITTWIRKNWCLILFAFPILRTLVMTVSPPAPFIHTRGGPNIMASS